MGRKRILILAADGLILAMALLLPQIAGAMIEGGPPCVSLQLGFLCPSCGATRCVRYFFSGQFAQAFAMNPYIFGLILYGAVWLAAVNVHILAGRAGAGKLVRGMISPTVVIVLAVGFALFGILRNFI